MRGLLPGSVFCGSVGCLGDCIIVLVGDGASGVSGRTDWSYIKPIFGFGDIAEVFLYLRLQIGL